MARRKATWDDKTLLLALSLTVITSLLTPYEVIVISIFLLISVHQLLLRQIFRGPVKRSLPFDDPDWEIIRADNNGVDAYGFVRFHEQKSDLIVFIHGWQSSSEKFIERMKIFHEEGLHTLAIDMRGHGMAPSTTEWTAGKVIQDVKAILLEIDTSKIGKIHFYGHSLGAFVCIGMHNSRHTGWWKDNYGTLMLESPMVAYSPIMENMASKVKFMLPLLKWLSVKGFNKIHPEAGGIEWEDIDIPSWGVPKVPILLLQAANDNRLGRVHYDLLLAQDIDVEAHLLDSLTHSRNRINVERDQLIRDWIETKIL
jgi:pimeloyl-ACP methyl ester carboxylesterase|tara:strand:+ start:766 stop:1701 length:936 start_codon:yes stop_codon:yes gene_type:complete